MSSKEAVRKEIVSLTSALVRIKSTKTNPAEIKRIADFVAGYFKRDKENITIRRVVRNNKHSLVILPKGVKKPKLLFLCHADVVEPSEKTDFNPQLRGDKLFGRGSADMKAGLAIAMLIFRKYHAKHSIGLAVTTDEEIGGFNGAAVLAKDARAGFVMANECSDNDIIVKEKGVVWVKLVAKGKSCHGSRPWLGKNAIEMLMDAYARMRKKLPHVRKESWKTTMNTGMISGGTAPNVVPEAAEMTLDIRFTEKYTADRIMKTVKDAVRGLPIKIVPLEKEPLLLNKKADNNILALKKSISSVLKKQPKLLAEHGASDARFFSQKKMAAVMFGPSGFNYHGKGEYLVVSSAVKNYLILERFIEKNV